MALKFPSLVLLAALVATGAIAQQATPSQQPPGAVPPASLDLGLDLGEVPAAYPVPLSPLRVTSSVPAAANGTPTALPPARNAAKAAPRHAARPVRPTALAEMSGGMAAGSSDGLDSEHVVYRRAPVRIELPVGRERIVTFPSTVALRTPEGFDALVRSQIIERTAYVTALAPFASLRVVAEDLETGRQIPIDLVAGAKTDAQAGSGAQASAPLRPLDVVVPGLPSDSGATDGAASADGRSEAATLDMVALTRYAVQSLYAPRRLVPATAGVRPLPVATVPVEGLYRGGRIETTPIGAWRSGSLYLTAVRATNRSERAQDLDLQELRGHWLAATAQHTRLLGAGSDSDTTTLYLVCDRPFEACR
jgi:integrating conjugative element protein (TIGR03749 family)